jgi:hypothetical protein
VANLLTKRRYFWDKGPLDVERDQYVIIERVLEYGTEDKVNTILAYFMYNSDAGEFERLEEKAWEATKMFFQGFLASE